jgi:hypothetical protein
MMGMKMCGTVFPVLKLSQKAYMTVMAEMA